MSGVDPAVDDWRRFAQGPDVLYNVLSWPEKRGSWTEEQFYAAGASDWADFKRHWDHYEPERGEVCVEVGCGVGRLTSQLAQAFDRVIALDVSADMIERARRVAGTNVDFRQVDGAVIPIGAGDVDALFSVHVMQHLENVSLLIAYIREMKRVLKVGGTLMVHIPLHGEPPQGRLGGRIEKLRQELALRQSRRALRKGGVHETMRTNDYWLNEVWQAFTDVGFRDVELRLIPVRSNGYGHQFWLARAS
jgi:SAM-dependent methyltransferase